MCRRSPARRTRSTSAKKKKGGDGKKGGGGGGGGGEDGTGKNWVDGGLGDGTLMVPFLLVFAPLFVQVLAYLTSAEGAKEVQPSAGLGLFGSEGGLLTHCPLDGGYARCLLGGVAGVLQKSMLISPSWAAAKFLLGFNALALLFDVSSCCCCCCCYCCCCYCCCCCCCCCYCSHNTCGSPVLHS